MSWSITSQLQDEPDDLGCDACLDRLHVWAEAINHGAARDVVEPTVAAHLRSCPDCAQDAEGLVALLRHEAGRS